jgi:colanic acid/amylovoran biosynthesis glycosyltransferase
MTSQGKKGSRRWSVPDDAPPAVETHESAHGRTGVSAPLRVALVVDLFPLVSETFIVDQVEALLERGVDVDILAFTPGDESNVSRTYFARGMSSRVTYLDYPLGKLSRVVRAWPRLATLAVRDPRLLLRVLNVARHGRWALSLKLLYWATPLAGNSYDIVHCHFGTVARNFVRVREVLQLDAPFVTTFYGVDVSRVFSEEPAGFYDELKTACDAFLVMSEDMRRRVIAYGFPPERVRVQPVGVAVREYPYHERSLRDGDELHVLAVGRFVEKKGFEDLLRAVAIVKERAGRPLRCTLVGGGPLDSELRDLAASLGLSDTVRFTGLIPVEQVIELIDEAHVLVAPSKTAADGDME